MLACWSVVLTLIGDVISSDLTLIGWSYYLDRTWCDMYYSDWMDLHVLYLVCVVLEG